MDFQITVVGYKEIAADLARASVEALPLARTAVEKVTADNAAAQQEEIFQMGAVDTGAMLGSVTAETRSTPGGAEGHAGPSVNYAGYVHEGARGRAGRPFMDRPALTAAEQLQKALEAVMRL